MGEDDIGNAIIGGGFSGLAAAAVSGGVCFEAAARPGGLCATYELEGFRFEVGGGHWLWGASTGADALLAEFAQMRTYERSAAVYFAESGRLVPFPLQENLWALDAAVRKASANELDETSSASRTIDPGQTLDDWLLASFGPTLHQIFFGPFNDRYTAGLSSMIEPADPAKTPIDIERVRLGVDGPRSSAGYNATFRYPIGGLGNIARGLADSCDVRMEEAVTAIDTTDRVLMTDRGSYRYDNLITTVALDRGLGLAGLSASHSDPHTSVLVINIAAPRMPDTPTEHWLYVPDSVTGFHRVGFYSSIEPDFLPTRAKQSHVSMYVEFAFVGGDRPDPEAEGKLIADTLNELSSWGWIGEVEVADATWVEVGYTWTTPESSWVQQSLAALDDVGATSAGRYATWASDVGSQGILSSLQQGLAAGRLYR